MISQRNNYKQEKKNSTQRKLRQRTIKNNYLLERKF